MPKRTDIKSILVIGAGPIVIGQACEFDYSGTQACRVLKKEGYRVILINSNPATIMTDPEVADRTYIEPINIETLEKIIERERPDAILPTVGGQTALNVAIAADAAGILKKYNVQLIGAQIDAINKAEDRKLFKEAIERIGLEVPRNAVVNSLKEAMKVLKTIGLPAIIRPSFTLGGSGGGIAYTKEQYKAIVTSGLEASPTNQVLIDESILGWKEYEMEVVRDQSDNAIIICSIENIDPMGVHTGDSITVAPALTLTDKEYQKMRNASIAILREIGVETGGSNVQFAINPQTGKMLVIEMNPRVSRSSALASKATGFPIASVAAKLAVGYRLNEIINDITKTTPASFEPSIDYVVVKIPRFTFEKFRGSENLLSSSMKSVGEVMAIGRSFKEALQKAMRSTETGISGFDEIPRLRANGNVKLVPLLKELEALTPDRLRLTAEAFRLGASVDQINQITKYDPWFLRQIKEIIAEEKEIARRGIADAEFFRQIKQNGFSDKRIAKLIGIDEEEVRHARLAFDIKPIYKRVDSCAGEFASSTAYTYSTFEASGEECEAAVSECDKIIILGSGPNRIGQGIEFDYACVHAAFAAKEMGIEAIMVNCNPETVSTDYDTSDRLYFEPITAEDVFAIIEKEQSKGRLLGVNVQFGGQTPLKLAAELEAAGIPLLGTPAANIALAEDRNFFKQMIEELGLRQPKNDICDENNSEDILYKAEQLGYPLIVRPSFVLGGLGMAIVTDQDDLLSYLKKSLNIFDGGALLLDSFLVGAIEVDVDAIADKHGDVYIAGIMEHIEEAGIHSGDSACSLPPFSLDPQIIDEIKLATIKIANRLGVCGLINIQFAIQDGLVYVLEVNPRASRTVPFVAKATGLPIAKIAAKVMAGAKLADFALPSEQRFEKYCVKEVVLPFARFAGSDVLLGPEMKSTGEVMGIDKSFPLAFAKAQLAAGNKIPTSGRAFISVRDADKPEAVKIAKALTDADFEIYATCGTAKKLATYGILAIRINKLLEGGDQILGLIANCKIDLVINTVAGDKSIEDSFSIRRAALMRGITYCTTIASAKVLMESILAIKTGEVLSVNCLQE